MKKFMMAFLIVLLILSCCSCEFFFAPFADDVRDKVQMLSIISEDQQLESLIRMDVQKNPKLSFDRSNTFIRKGSVGRPLINNVSFTADNYIAYLSIQNGYEFGVNVNAEASYDARILLSESMGLPLENAAPLDELYEAADIQCVYGTGLKKIRFNLTAETLDDLYYSRGASFYLVIGLFDQNSVLADTFVISVHLSDMDVFFSEEYVAYVDEAERMEFDRADVFSGASGFVNEYQVIPVAGSIPEYDVGLRLTAAEAAGFDAAGEMGILIKIPVYSLCKAGKSYKIKYSEYNGNSIGVWKTLVQPDDFTVTDNEPSLIRVFNVHTEMSFDTSRLQSNPSTSILLRVFDVTDGNYPADEYLLGNMKINVHIEIE